MLNKSFLANCTARAKVRLGEIQNMKGKDEKQIKGHSRLVVVVRDLCEELLLDGVLGELVLLGDGHLELGGLGVHVADVDAALRGEEDDVRVAGGVDAYVRLLALREDGKL